MHTILHERSHAGSFYQSLVCLFVRTVQVKVARGLKGERYRAALVGADPDKDVAVIKIDTQGKVLTCWQLQL